MLFPNKSRGQSDDGFCPPRGGNPVPQSAMVNPKNIVTDGNPDAVSYHGVGGGGFPPV